MALTAAERDVDEAHLYPPFRFKVQAILSDLNGNATVQAAGLQFVLFEGFRSQARQNYLYSQGRANPGSIVTQLRVSRHTSGIAADLVPLDVHGSPVWNAAPEVWSLLRSAAHAHELKSGQDYKHFTDLPHVEATPAQQRLWYADAKSFLVGLSLVPA